MTQNTYAQIPNPMQQGRQLNVMLVPDINNIETYPINPGSSMLFLNESMTEFKMRSRDVNGFPCPERTWSLKETTPPQQNSSQFATREEVKNIENKLDEVLETLKDFMK